ncbi:hypothetical protein NEF87_000126 [Candidatus Lokiarchaeum ossiferum]|uniref:Leucine-rich repeat domain-containing protein n=1 Tax=Candidatus Lokiarchaeum ossiferum TaxID=2951803 RepID=A0ABY6HJY5_9ARCH|nr:hypothetical protein NEF87_000126 [Candidatus Lokiarchaeum sp. B-35]
MSNLRNLSLSKKSLRKIEGLNIYTDLVTLVLNHNEIQKIEGLDNLRKIEILKMNDNQIHKIENLSHLTNLKNLSLSRNLIQKVEGLDNLCNLRSLNLSYNDISKIEGLDKNFELRQLRIRDNIHIRKIEGLDNLRSLQVLDLGIINIVKIEGLSYLHSLKDLIFTLPKNCEVDLQIEGFEHLISAKNIDIDYYKFQEEFVDSKTIVCLLRFACIIKTQIKLDDWQRILMIFPGNFWMYSNTHSIDHVNWYLNQCQPHLEKFITDLTSEQNYHSIYNASKKNWDLFLTRVKLFLKESPQIKPIYEIDPKL